MDDIPTSSPEGPRPPQSGPTPPPIHSVPPPLVQPRVTYGRPRNNSGWKIFAIVCLVLLLGSLIFNPLHMLSGAIAADGMQRHVVGPRIQEAYLQDNHSRNKIAVIPIDGVISGQGLNRSGVNMVDLIDEQFRRAAKDDSVKAVILKVDSPGGEVLASDEIYRIIQKFQSTNSKPVISSMGSVAASGGYYVSAPCQWIVANELTITGSIGVIMHGYNFRGLMDKVGVRPEVFKSGKFKDMLSPDKKLEDITAEERELIQSMVNETFDKFKSVVKEGRDFAVKRNKSGADGARVLVDNWEQFADGRILSGKDAVRHGFVDELGNFDVAVSRARKLCGIKDADLIQYLQPFDLSDIFGLFGKSESRAIKIDMGIDTPKLKLGNLYFLCPLVVPR